MSSWQALQSRFAKKKRAICPDREVGESKGDQEPYLGERGESDWKHEEKRMDSTAKEGRFQGRGGGQAKRTSLEKAGGE